MNLYILRHANAGTSRANPVLDARRPLDKEGKQHCLHLAHTLNALKISFDVIVSSPLKRALQTAQLVATETSYEAQITQSKALAPEATDQDFRRLLDELARPKEGLQLPRESVLCVGHNPNLSAFLGGLLVDAAGEVQPGIMPKIRLRKGSMARVGLVRGAGGRWSGTLLSLIDPRIVRALYRTSTVNSRRSTSRK